MKKGDTNGTTSKTDDTDVADGLHVTARTVYDTATMTGGTTGAGGTISFYYQKQTNATPTCSNGTLINGAVNVNAGNATYKSANVTSERPGDLRVLGRVLGDGNNKDATSDAARRPWS